MCAPEALDATKAPTNTEILALETQRAHLIPSPPRESPIAEGHSVTATTTATTPNEADTAPTAPASELGAGVPAELAPLVFEFIRPDGSRPPTTTMGALCLSSNIQTIVVNPDRSGQGTEYNIHKVLLDDIFIHVCSNGKVYLSNIAQSTFNFFVEFLYKMAVQGSFRVTEQFMGRMLASGRESISKNQMMHQVASLAILLKYEDLYTVAKLVLENMGDHNITEFPG